MKKKSESINPSLEEIIDKLKQTNLYSFEKVDLCSLLIEKLGTKTQTNEDSVKWLLGQQLSPDIINNFFCAAAKNGHLELVQYLMTLPGVDPTAQNNYAIRLAARNGHLGVVNYLITLPAVDPRAQDNDAIRWASKRKHEEIIKILALSPFYNTFIKQGQDIMPKKEEEKEKEMRELLEPLIGAQRTIKLIEEANPKFTCLLLNYSFFSGNKDVDKLITKVAIAHNLQTGLQPT